jgi:hypothetical protein
VSQQLLSKIFLGVAGKSALLPFFSPDIPVNNPLRHSTYRKRALVT